MKSISRKQFNAWFDDFCVKNEKPQKCLLVIVSGAAVGSVKSTCKWMKMNVWDVNKAPEIIQSNIAPPQYINSQVKTRTFKLIHQIINQIIFFGFERVGGEVGGLICIFKKQIGRTCPKFYHKVHWRNAVNTTTTFNKFYNIWKHLNKHLISCFDVTFTTDKLLCVSLVLKLNSFDEWSILTFKLLH